MKRYRRVKVRDPQFTERERSILCSAMRRLWETTGGDIEAACEEAGETLTNLAAIEAVLDAERLEQDAGLNMELQHALVKFRKLDWNTQIRFAANRLTLA